jgi:hypothetical protein
MARTVNKLIEQSFKKAGLFTQDRVIEGFRTTEALDMLNDIISENSSDGTYVAFYKTLQFPVIAGTKSYTIGKNVGNDVDHERISDLKYCVLIYSNTRYPVKVLSDYDYYDNAWSVSESGRPSSVFVQNGIGESTLTFPLAPDANYTCEIKAKFILDTLALNTDITNVPPYFFRYWKYALAKDLALEYMPGNWGAAHEQVLQKLERHLQMINDIDMNLRVSNALRDNCNGIYGIGIIT